MTGTILLLLDQWSKRMIRLYTRGCLTLGPIVQIRCVLNRNRIYRRNAARALLVLIWFSAPVSAALLYRSGAWFQSPVAVIGLGLALGGSAGNLLDILQHRYVVDFIDLRWWPVFNLADLAIVAGLIMAFYPQG